MLLMFLISISVVAVCSSLISCCDKQWHLFTINISQILKIPFLIALRVAESPIFGCRLEASKRKGKMTNTCVIHMLLLTMRGISEAVIGRYTCKMTNLEP